MLNISSKNPFVRKLSCQLLQLPRTLRRINISSSEFQLRPPVFVNSFPKSGTHLLNQIVDGIPGYANYGAFISSMTSSFQYKERTTANTLGCLQSVVPGEIVRGHCYYEPEYENAMHEKNFAHFFIYRDLRDVAVSTAYYLRDMNRWHRLHKYFEGLSDADAILLAINGDPNIPSFPDIGTRFDRYQGWLTCPDVCSLRFEDVSCEDRVVHLMRLATYFVERGDVEISSEELADRMSEKINPGNSHTLRRGISGGWQSAFDANCIRAFHAVADKHLIELGYEESEDWG